jgi:hypothetical protein
VVLMSELLFLFLYYSVNKVDIMHSGGFSIAFYMNQNNLNLPCIALFSSFLIGHIISPEVAK